MLIRPTTLEEAITIIEQQQAIIAKQQVEILELQQKLLELQEFVGLNSKNSSFSPSQKPPKGNGKLRKLGQRNRGGQKGHQGTHREALPDEDIDTFIPCKVPEVCSCGATLEPGEDFVPHQQYALPKLKLTTIQYQRQKAVCPKCSQTVIAPLPAGVATGLLDTHLLSLAGVLATEYKLSKQKLSNLFQQLFGLKLAASTFSHQERYLQRALNLPYAQLKAFLRKQAFQYIDETSFRQGNADGQNPDEKQSWLWVQVSEQVTAFTLALSRGQNVLQALLGDEFENLVVSDRFSAYDTLSAQQRAVCWAHLSRDFQRIAERSSVAGELGEALVCLASKMFTTRSRYLDGELSKAEMTEQMEKIRNDLIELLEYGSGLGGQGRSENARSARTCQRILKLEPCLWRFLEHEGLEPTNNGAERAIRPAVTQRKVLYGTQSERGSRFQERMHSVLATCKQQGRNAVEYCTQALNAHFGLGQAPSLLPSTPTT